MYLTQKDLEKIACYIGKLGVKDSDFPELTDATGEEFVVVVSNGANYRVKLSDFLDIVQNGGTGGVLVSVVFRGVTYTNLLTLLVAMCRAIESGTGGGGGGTGIYTPSALIPNGTLSEEHGGLSASSKEALSSMTYDELFDKILFKEKPAYLVYNDNCTITPIKDLEVGTTYNGNSFKYNTTTALYGYPEGSKLWTYITPSTTGTVRFGAVNSISCLFKVNFGSSYTLTSSYGTNSSLVLADKVSIKTGVLTGYYKYGWEYPSNEGVPTNYSLSRMGTMSSQLTGEVLSCTNSTSAIYVALPVEITLLTVLIRNGLSGIYETLPSSYYEIVSNNVSIGALSTINKYNIWKINKAAPNYDGSITPNDLPIKITTV